MKFDHKHRMFLNKTYLMFDHLQLMFHLSCPSEPLILHGKKIKSLAPTQSLKAPRGFGGRGSTSDGWRKTGVEVGGESIWWNDLRPVHAFMYGLFALLALNGVKEHAWKVLLLDTIIGLLAFTQHHFG